MIPKVLEKWGMIYAFFLYVFYKPDFISEEYLCDLKHFSDFMYFKILYTFSYTFKLLFNFYKSYFCSKNF